MTKVSEKIYRIGMMHHLADCLLHKTNYPFDNGLEYNKNYHEVVGVVEPFVSKLSVEELAKIPYETNEDVEFYKKFYHWAYDNSSWGIYPVKYKPDEEVKRGWF